MRSSAETSKVFVAFIAAQADLVPAPKDSTNPHFKSRYADLASCVEVSRPILAKHGLAVIQVALANGNMIGIETTIVHASGEFFSGEVWCEPRSWGAQDVGAATTYLRRYGYSTIVGLVTEEDDDGNAAAGIASRSHPPPKAPIPAAKSVIYNNHIGEHQDAISAILKKGKVHESVWPEIGKKLNGRPFTDLRTVTDAVLAELAGDIPFDPGIEAPR